MMAGRKQAILYASVIALCLAVAGTGFFLGIYTMADARNSQPPIETGESFVERYDLPDVRMDEDIAFFNHTLANRFVFDFILVNASFSIAEDFSIIPALAIDEGPPVWMGTTDRPVFDVLHFSSNVQYVYPCSTPVTFPVNHDYALFLYVHYVSAVPTADFTIIVGYTVYS